MAYWQLGQQDEARKWYKTGLARMRDPANDVSDLSFEKQQMQTEAEQLMGIRPDSPEHAEENAINK
jgi:hypothetical protein